MSWRGEARSVVAIHGLPRFARSDSNSWMQPCRRSVSVVCGASLAGQAPAPAQLLHLRPSAQVFAHNARQFEHRDLVFAKDLAQLGIGVDGALVGGVLQAIGL